jgi:hypothetical protein
MHVALIFLVPVLGPLIARLLLEGNSINIAMGLMAALFALLLVSTTRHMYLTTRDSLLRPARDRRARAHRRWPTARRGCGGAVSAGEQHG